MHTHTDTHTLLHVGLHSRDTGLCLSTCDVSYLTISSHIIFSEYTTILLFLTTA